MSFSETLLCGTATVHECLEDGAIGAPKPRSIAKGLRESCILLGDLVIDPEFLGFLRETRQTETFERGIAILKEYKSSRVSMDDFLNAERELFHRAGLTEPASDHLVQRCRDVIVEGRYDHRSVVGDSLTDLQRYVCKKADQLEVGRRRGILGGIRDVFGGLTVAALNSGFLAATMGLSGAFATASITVGGFIAGKGYEAVRDHY